MRRMLWLPKWFWSQLFGPHIQKGPCIALYVYHRNGDKLYTPGYFICYSGFRCKVSHQLNFGHEYSVLTESMAIGWVIKNVHNPRMSISNHLLSSARQARFSGSFCRRMFTSTQLALKMQEKPMLRRCCRMSSADHSLQCLGSVLGAQNLKKITQRRKMSTCHPVYR